MSAGEPTCLLIADISGYTSYLAGVELDHAQDILADLVGTVVTALRPTFRLAKLEGDAAFMSAPAGAIDGTILLDVVERCFFGFRRRRRDVRQATSCECNACVRIPDLNLKFVVHQGVVAQQRMAGLDELVGSDVIVVHRLLKNSVVESTGTPAYALLSQAVVETNGLDPVALGMARHVEAYDHIGDVVGWVHDLERRWVEEEHRQRVIVDASSAVLVTDVASTAPPQVAWEYLTKPGRRLSWSSQLTDFIVEAPGNRRGVGTTNHCIHGPDAVLEEVLDWRPFDYYTVRTTLNTPAGPVRFLTTVEVEPTTAGTTIHMRHGPPKSKRELAILMEGLPTFERIFATNGRALAAELEVEERARAAAGAEPTLPSPHADGPLAGLQALQIIG
jgi:uncharacterized protein DUF2652/polyketide cyclase/dehydrase/lipid transport protein